MTPFEHALEKLEFDKIRQRLIRHASSDVGREILQGLTIMTSVDEIDAELSRVSAMKRLIEEEEDLPLGGIHPIRAAVQKAAVEGSLLQPRDLAHISSTLRAARVLRTFLSKRHDTNSALWQIAEPLYIDKVLEFNIDQAIDETGSIRENASKRLQSIRRAIADRYEHLRTRLASILRNVAELGFSQEDIITTREGRMVIPVKSEHKNRVQGFIHSASASGATVFVEPSETLDLNNEIRSLQFEEQREIEHIIRILTEQVGTARDPLLRNLTILSRLDALHAKGRYSVEILGTQPQIGENLPITLVQARHPILLLTHGYNHTVPLDLDLGRGYHTLVISGPNAGGKSVAMKCVGLLTLMAQAGLHVPAGNHTTLRVFKNMFAEIGDEQSIENDLSTFSSHLANLKAIADEASEQSLVLIDEIGSGTDPTEGGAIAAALLEALTNRGAFTVATTHQSALKVFAHETEGIENGAMEFDQSTLTPTYRFKSGIPGSSYALEMAGRQGFDQAMLNRARILLGQQHAHLEALIAELESSAQQYRKDNETLREEKERLDDLVKEYESRLASQSSELKALKRQAVDEARSIVENANATIERNIRQLRERGADSATIKESHEEIHRLRHEIESIEEVLAPEPSHPPDHLKAGSTVRHRAGTQTGEVISIAPDRKSAVVVFGNVKMKVATFDLVEAGGRQRTTTTRIDEGYEKPAKIEHELDLRGMTGEEALPLVDKFLDTASLAGLHRVDIIHGKGTGALRKKVSDFLSRHPRVRSFRLGEWNEGGTGATVVELSEH